MTEPRPLPDLIALGATWNKRMNNADTWIDQHDVERPIASLSAEHRSNIRRYLRRHAARLELVTSLYLLMHVPDDMQGGNGMADEIDDFLAVQSTLEWLYATPLFKALVAADGSVLP